MDSAVLEAVGVSVKRQESVAVGSLRYFVAPGSFTAAMVAVLGGPLPPPLGAVRHDSEEGSAVVLAWRSPTETLVVCHDAARVALIEHHAAGRADGCFVDQSGGIVPIQISGPRMVELLSRLVSVPAIPQPGQALTARYAELGVTALCLRPGEIQLLVERCYVAHLMAWMGETLADF
jgi:sarcosine oxidase gamma subunit